MSVAGTEQTGPLRESAGIAQIGAKLFDGCIKRRGRLAGLLLSLLAKLAEQLVQSRADVGQGPGRVSGAAARADVFAKEGSDAFLVHVGGAQTLGMEPGGEVFGRRNVVLHRGAAIASGPKIGRVLFQQRSERVTAQPLPDIGAVKKAFEHG